MAIEIVFLGTSAMVPTKERNQTGIFLLYNGEGLLFDCGEGIQRQLKLAEERLTKVTRIFISHWHGDHVLGLPGLIQSLNSSKYEQEHPHLDVYGPKGTKKLLQTVLSCFTFDQKITLEVHEFKPQGSVVCTTDDFVIHAYLLEHSIPTYGFTFQEHDRRKIDLAKVKKLGLPEGPLLGELQRGKAVVVNKKKIQPDDVSSVVVGNKVGYIADTSFCKNCLTLAQDCDLLIAEATYHSDDEEKAERYQHLTAKQTAHLAQQANVGKLIITHFSQRYKTVTALEEEARDIFPETVAAYDFMRIKM